MGDEKDPIEQTEVWSWWSTFIWGCIITAIFMATQLMVIGLYIGAIHGNVPENEIAVLMQQLQSNGTVISLATLATLIVGSLVTFGIIKLKKQSRLGPYLGLKLASGSETKKWLVIFIALLILSEVLNYLFDKNEAHDFMVTAYLTAEPIWLLWIAMVVAAPVFEELFFRGFLLEGFRRSFIGTTGAVVLTSLLWAVIHTQYDLYYMTTIFVMGVVLGIVRIQTGSVALTIGLHALNNGLAMLQTAYFMVGG